MKRVTAAILKNGGRILIAKRKETDKLAGKWEFPGGKVKAGETPQECLAREMEEEFGIEVNVGAFFGETTHRYASGPIKLIAYHTTWIGGSFSLNAHADVRWVTPEQFHDFDFAPADMPFVKKLQQKEIWYKLIAEDKTDTNYGSHN